MSKEDGIVRIALVGKMRSGKSTIAHALSFRHGFDYPYAFGNALKIKAHEIFPDVPTHPKPRALYQFMNVMRDFDEDVWVKHLEHSITLAEDRKSTIGIVVEDARQENEVEFLRSRGFTIVRVESPEEKRREIIEQEDKLTGDELEDAMTHKTEAYSEQVTPDLTIVNDGSYDELMEKVDDMMAEIRGIGDETGVEAGEDER